MSKKSVVLFLGAGFSKSISENQALPLGGELLERILPILDGETQDIIKKRLLRDVLSTQETACDNTAAIQSFKLLAIVQRLRSQQLAGRPRLSDIDANQLWRKLVEGVVQVTRFGHGGYAEWCAGDTEFSKFIAFLQEASSEASVSIVTTNYDLIADKAAIYVTDQYLAGGGVMIACHCGQTDLPKDLRHFQYGYPIRGVTKSAKRKKNRIEGYEPWALARGNSSLQTPRKYELGVLRYL